MAVWRGPKRPYTGSLDSRPVAMTSLDILTALFALLFVLGLILGLGLLARRFGPRMLGQGGSRRLQVVEALPLDGRRRLMLIRRDDREHLLLTGGSTDLVIEGDIAASRPGVSAP